MTRLILARLSLAALLPVMMAIVLGLAGWRAWQQVQTAQTVQLQVAAAIKDLQARQADYAAGGPGYARYGALLNSGFANPAPPAELRGVIRKLAKQHEIGVLSIDIGEKQNMAAPEGTTLALTNQSLFLTVSAATDTALFAFIDALRQTGRAELTLKTMRLQPRPDRVTADLSFSWDSLDGAPQLDYTATPIILPDKLAGKSLLAPPATAAPETTAMILQVEQVKP